MRRNVAIVISVLALHLILLWALQTGLLHRAAQVLLPEVVLVEIMAPAVTRPPPPPPPPQSLPPPNKPAPVKAPSPPIPAPPQPAAPAPSPAPSPVATQVAAPQPAPLSVAATAAPPTATTAAPPATNNAAGGNAAAAPQPAAPKVELPSSDADYLNNPKPAYPAQSKRLMETGRVVVRVFIAADGQASQATVKQSSGFDRLDQASVENAMKWRYVPGKRDGVPQGMWFDVPFNWQLSR